jgi:hypothetical protein
VKRGPLRSGQARACCRGGPGRRSLLRRILVHLVASFDGIPACPERPEAVRVRARGFDRLPEPISLCWPSSRQAPGRVTLRPRSGQAPNAFPLLPRLNSCPNSPTTDLVSFMHPVRAANPSPPRFCHRDAGWLLTPIASCPGSACPSTAYPAASAPVLRRLAIASVSRLVAILLSSPSLTPRLPATRSSSSTCIRPLWRIPVAAKVTAGSDRQFHRSTCRGSRETSASRLVSPGGSCVPQCGAQSRYRMPRAPTNQRWDPPPPLHRMRQEPLDWMRSPCDLGKSDIHSGTDPNMPAGLSGSKSRRWEPSKVNHCGNVDGSVDKPGSRRW